MSEKGINATEYTRTDLALELHGEDSATRNSYPLSPHRSVTVLHQKADGEKYVTLSFDKATELVKSELDGLARRLAKELSQMATDVLKTPPGGDTRILVAGLGNAYMTPDAIGPIATEKINATRHLKVLDRDTYAALGCCELSCTSPGVLGQTGIESAELVRSAAESIRPHLIVAIDALAARSPDRLASTVQLSACGIAPGSGIGNTRAAIDRHSMGCPVIAIGVPTVVDSSVLVYDALGRAGIPDGDIGENLRAVLERGKSFIVAPKDADKICEVTSVLISSAVNMAFGIHEP